MGIGHFTVEATNDVQLCVSILFVGYLLMQGMEPLSA